MKYFFSMDVCEISQSVQQKYTARKVIKYEVFSGQFFPVFGPNTGKYLPEKTPYLDIFHVVLLA